MPRKCRGNYRKCKGVSDEVDNSVFRFPKDTERRAEWIRRIPQANLDVETVTDNMVVCERHFDSRFIIRTHSATLADGSVVSSPRDSPILDKDAIPTIFPNVPSYLSSTAPQKRKHPDDRRAQCEVQDEQRLNQWHDSDVVNAD